MTEKKKVERPVMVRIDRNFSKESKRLYKNEEMADAYITTCARWWMKIMNAMPNELWTVGVPQALFDLLERFQPDCAEIAATAFLEMRGYQVGKKVP